MNPDGLSYLDIGTETLRNGPSALVNGLWSPGYPALLSLALLLFRPAPHWEFPLVHLVNLFIFVLDLWAFHFFLQRWLSYEETLRPQNEAARRYIVPFAFCVFLLFTLQDGGLRAVNPDLCVIAIVFLIAGISCRLALPGSGRLHYVALGLALGLGYYAKAPMLPLGLVLVAGFLIYPPSRLVSRRRLLLSMSVFLLTAAPLVALLSQRVGHLSLGEAGKLNYAWHVNGLQPYAGWTGSNQGQTFSSLPVYGLLPPPASASDAPHLSGVPEHPPRTLMEKPFILEFASPVKGTFPLWYDPAYWYAGAKARFDLRQQIAALKETFGIYERFFLDSPKTPLLGGAIALCLVAGRREDFFGAPRSAWLFAWPLAAMLAYVFVHVELRYIAGFGVLLWLSIYGALTARVNRGVAAAVCAAVGCAMMIPFLFDMAQTGFLTAGDLAHSRQPDYEVVAVALRNLGLRSGDRLAVVGFPFDPLYAHYDGLRVVATIPATDEFWNLSEPELRSVGARLAQIGVKALVAQKRPLSSTPANWRDVNLRDSGPFSILLLSEPAPKVPLE
jgi:hypothetical protein